MSSREKEGVCRLELLVQGRVQGVGFRYFVRSTAERLTLNGWVKNERDGSVRIIAEGPREELNRLREAVRQGPPAARVGHVEETWTNGAGDVHGFSVRG